MRLFDLIQGGHLAAFFIGVFFLSATGLQSQEHQLRAMFYNVENLFDTIDQPEFADEDFTPQGRYGHNSSRYVTKVKNLRRVIDTTFDGSFPSLIGLAEVENRQVLRDLVNAGGGSWRIVHRDSPDGRGIDNALLYDARELTILDSSWIEVDLGEEERPTRDILEAKFLWKNEYVIYVYVNHWPSRYGGAEESAWKRNTASQTLQHRLQYIRNNDCLATIIVMGDMNDHPSNTSVGALSNCNNGPCLYNTVAKFEGTDIGSHAYRGEWGILDHILVSKDLLVRENLILLEDESGFVKHPFMLYEDRRSGAFFPSRTYSGSNYYGGFSDHLPVKVVIAIQ